jgi:hypothetical protein
MSNSGENLYTYTANNPVMYTDSTGYAPTWLKYVGAAVLAVAIVAVAFLTAGAVIAAAPAIAAFAQTTVIAYVGSTALASTAASVVSLGAAVLAASTVALGINEAVNVISGNNYLRKVIGDSFYNGFSATVATLSYGYIMAGYMLPYPSTSMNTSPGNLKGQIAMNNAKSYPSSGTSLFGKVPMNDPRMPGWLGWTKYQMSFDGNTVHYVGNRYLDGWYPFDIWFDYKFVGVGNE